jgi:hypothetical protein
MRRDASRRPGARDDATAPARRAKREHAHQRHFETGARIGRNGKIARVRGWRLVVELNIFGLNQRCSLSATRRIEQSRRPRSRHELLQRVTREQRGEIVEHLAIVGRKLLERTRASSSFAAITGAQSPARALRRGSRSLVPSIRGALPSSTVPPPNANELIPSVRAHRACCRPGGLRDQSHGDRVVRNLFGVEQLRLVLGDQCHGAGA